MIQERKLHKKHLLEQQETIRAQREEKLSEHKCMLQIYKQLTSLEDRLLSERNRSTRMGWRYLEEEKGMLDSFTQCVEKCNEIIDKLTSINELAGNESAIMEEAAKFEAVEAHLDLMAGKNADLRSKYR